MNPLELAETLFGLSPVVQLGILGFVGIAVQQIRQGHIGRVGIFGAAIVVAQYAYPAWESLSVWVRGYTALAGIFGSVSILSYLTGTSLPSGFYRIALVLFGGGSLIFIVVFVFPV